MGDYLEQEKVINCPWIDYIGVKKILPPCESTCKKIITEIVKEMKTNKEFYFNTRPIRVPTRKVVEKYNIDVNLIRREAKRIRR